MTVEVTTLSATIYLKSSDGGILVLVGRAKPGGEVRDTEIRLQVKFSSSSC